LSLYCIVIVSLNEINGDGDVLSVVCQFIAGQTQVKQEDVLKSFKDGKHKLIIATSVAEEGLDVRQCNWIIKYEHVTNSVARVQSRGELFVTYLHTLLHVPVMDTD